VAILCTVEGIMKTYNCFVEGVHVNNNEWSYVIEPDFFMSNPASAIRLKRRLDRGDDSDLLDQKLVLGRIGLASPQDCQKANSAAREACGVWAQRSRKFREQIVVAMHNRIVERSQEYIMSLVNDGHPRNLAAWEVSGVIAGGGQGMFDVLSAFMGFSIETPIGLNQVERRPDGVVAIVLPRNAAGANAAMALPILAAGNSVIMKAPRNHSYAAAWLFHEVILPVLDEFKIDEPVCQFLCCHPRMAIDSWLNSKEIDDIFFIGSSERGKELEIECVRRGIKPILELSGNDPIVVWRDADVRNAAKAAAECYMGSAQICIVPKVAFVHHKVIKEFLEYLRIYSLNYKPQKISKPGSFLAPVGNSKGMLDALELVHEEGGNLLFGGQRLNDFGERDKYGVFFEPAAALYSIQTACRSHIVLEETFFPLLPIVNIDERDESECMRAVEYLLRLTKHRLRMSIWSTDMSFCKWLSSIPLGFGTIKINSSHTEFIAGLPTQGGRGASADVHGEANYPFLRTSHLEATVWRGIVE